MIVNFSGGKDSSALLHLVLECTDNVECVFMESSIDLPGSVDFVKKQAERFSVKLHITNPKRDYYGDFFYWLDRFGYFPATGYSWCQSRLKARPQRAYFRKIMDGITLYKLTGVRIKESSRRGKIYSGNREVQKDNEDSRAYLLHPLLRWSNKNVADYLCQCGIAINSNYKPFGVSGCYYCPFYQKQLYLRIMNAYPHIFDKIIEVEERFQKPSVVNNTYMKDIKRAFMEQSDIFQWIKTRV